MATAKSKVDTMRSTQEVFSPAELGDLCLRIANSGVLGRSRHYLGLLEYLVQCSIDGKTPKEIELALDVLGRADDFDVTSDSTVRVYVHQLRKKLDTYYELHEQDAAYRIVIPKGKYVLAAKPQRAADQQAILPNPVRRWFNLNTGLLTLMILLLAGNLIWISTNNNAQVIRASQVAAQVEERRREAAAEATGKGQFLAAPESARLAVKERVPVWDNPGPALRIMQRIKSQLDPAGLLNPGRFVGGI